MAAGLWHRVRGGQRLPFLAEWYYGDSKAWSHIYYANLDIYGDNFELIPAGSKVFIPDLEASPSEQRYTGPDVLGLFRRAPVREGPTQGGFEIKQEETGEKYLILIFTGPGQEVL